jgi:hypothetical protein
MKIALNEDGNRLRAVGVLIVAVSWFILLSRLEITVMGFFFSYFFHLLDGLLQSAYQCELLVLLRFNGLLFPRHSKGSVRDYGVAMQFV